MLRRTGRALKRKTRKLLLPDTPQQGEARALEEIAEKYNCDSSIVDVGANDGWKASNSALFVKRGWRAILIEPLPERRKPMVCRSPHNPVRVQTEVLTNILRAQQFPKHFGILLVDAEGMDVEVLCGVEFSKYRPRLLVTEEYEWNMEKHAAKYSLLIRNGYSLVQKLGYNTILVDRRYLYYLPEIPLPSAV
jgi:hypothetical protein